MVPEQDSAEMSSYERSTDSDFKKKKKKKKKKTHKNNAAADDEFDELPASPFREKFTDDEMAKAIQKLLRQGIPVTQSMHAHSPPPRIDFLYDCFDCSCGMLETS